MSRFVDAGPMVRERYDRELAKLRAERGEPSGMMDRLRYRWAVRRLRFRYLGMRAWLVRW